jgi:hypothetical protein
MICCKVITLALFPLAGLFVAVVTKVSNLTALSFGTIFKSEILEVVPMLISLDEPPILSAKAVPVKPVPGPLNIPPDEITSLAIKFS